MPHHFDRFRLLNGGKRLRNESADPVYVKAEDPDPQVEVPPGGEIELPFSPAGEVIIEIPKYESS